MSSWGVGTFQDDIACDWLEDLLESDPEAFLWHCLDLRGLDYLEYLACIGVVCSAEIILGLCTTPRAGLPEAVHTWLKQNPQIRGEAFLPAAISGIRQVIGSRSEMKERWEDQGEWYPKWRSSVSDLEYRLNACQRRAVSESVTGLPEHRADPIVDEHVEEASDEAPREPGPD